MSSRRTQAQRRAASSRRIIAATIRCLYRDGYGATTTDKIIAEAGVSRGGLQHHFPTRVDLMVQVCRYVWAFDRRALALFARRYPDPRERLLARPDFSWRLMSRSGGVAVLELLVASRSDQELAARFIPEHRIVQREAIAGTHAALEQAGIAQILSGEALHRYTEACVRGLVIDAIFDERVQPDVPPGLRFIRAELERAIAAAA
ncbi:TetR/AcrR family transcriptional regulator [Sphingobium chlorophenolicum]|uniref:TetR/AcrR family transcriptional regulator n=1 Tax=Sphingobium chlorophenolicum TaxID=46429 RepID=UPI00142F1BAA|nr:TetR/AcrR family transcriptional regulator [Sphingobium chlorophenolicum]